MRELLRTTGDVEAFLRSFAVRIVGEKYGFQPGESARDGKRLAEIRAELAALPAAAPEGGEAEDPQRRRLDEELLEIVRKYHAQGRSTGVSSLVTTHYTGGISLAPRLFSVKKSEARPALDKLKVASRTAGTTWGAAGWIRSGGKQAASTSAPRAPAVPATPAPSGGPPVPIRSRQPAAATTRPQPPTPEDTPESVAPALPIAAPAMNSIAVPGSGSPAGAALVGRLGDDRRIVFTRAPR